MSEVIRKALTAPGHPDRRSLVLPQLYHQSVADQAQARTGKKLEPNRLRRASSI
jgi:hypothetical protein